MNLRKFVLLVAASMFTLVLLGCPRARLQDASGTVTVTCPAGARCTRTVSGTIRITFPFSEFSANQTYAGILDLSNEWIPVNTPASTARIRLSSSTGATAEGEFEIVQVSNSEVSSVDKDTTPVVLAYANPSLVNDFFAANAELFERTDDVVEVTISTPIQRSQCQTPSGKYPTHIRYLDSAGVTYLTTMQFDYQAPDVYHNGCDEGSFEILY